MSASPSVGSSGRFLASGGAAPPVDRRISVDRSPRIGDSTAQQSATSYQQHASGSSRRLNTYGSGRRVNFDHQMSIGSARRSNEATGTSFGSSSRNITAGGGLLGNPQATSNAEQQQSATHSAVSMNSIFNEARREIRRGNMRDSAIRAAEYKAAGGESDQLLPPTPQQVAAKDLEAGSPAVGGVAPESEAVAEVTELNYLTDLVALREMLAESPVLALMLLCIPVGIFAHFTGIGGVSAIFVFNFVAIIPLAWLLGNATEELALRSNQTLGGLLNATFGNAVELIVSIVALRKGMIKLVQTSLLGSILSNCLLVLGMAFLLGGLKNKVQMYNQKGAHMLSSLLLLASIALVLPAAFVNSFTPHPTMAHLLRISRVTAALMFCIYLLYLFFQLFTHAEMFSDENSGNNVDSPIAPSIPVVPLVGGASNGRLHHGHKKVSASPSASGSSSATIPADVTNSGYQSSSRVMDGYGNGGGSDIEEEVVEVEAVSDHMNELGDLSTPLPPHSASPASSASAARKSASKKMLPASIAEEESRISPPNARDEQTDTETDEEEDEEDEEYEGEDEPQLTFTCSLVLLVVVTLCVAVCSEFLVDSIDEITAAWGMNESFVGIILIPIVGNAAEHATAVTVAMKNKMDLAIGVAIGSSTQIALFLIPFVVLLGWAIDQPMSLNFSGFETICLTMAVLMVNFLVKNGESNWLQGVMLMAVYCIIATAFWYVPEVHDQTRYQNHPSESWMPTDVQQEPRH